MILLISTLAYGLARIAAAIFLIIILPFIRKEMSNIGENEVWKQLKDFDNYAISNLGRLKNVKTGDVLKPSIYNSGYPMAALYKNTKKKRVGMHRLVAELFIPNPQKRPFVCHRDDNPLNNKVSNLFWGTPKMNSEDMVSKGRQNKGENVGLSKLTEKEVMLIRKTSKLYPFFSYNDIGKIFKTSKHNVGKILTNKTWKHLKK